MKITGKLIWWEDDAIPDSNKHFPREHYSAEIDISPEELARQMSEQGYFCCPVDNLKSDKTSYYISEQKSYTYNDVDKAYQDGWHAGFNHGKLSKPQSQECSCKEPKKIEELCLPVMLTESPNAGQIIYIRDKINEIIEQLNKER